MPKGWRFRSTWCGTLVLQRGYAYDSYDAHGGGASSAYGWRDANTTDMVDYLQALMDAVKGRNA